MTIKVLVVDDSSFIREMLKTIISADVNLQVVGTAENPYEAREAIKTLQPDVITLDIEMPRMNGLAFLKNLMKLRPTPVIMFSSFTSQGSAESLEALELGAVDVVGKPSSHNPADFVALKTEMVEKIKAAAQAKLHDDLITNAPLSSSNVQRSCSLHESKALITIGASTGGTEAIKEVLSNLSENIPPVLITQHIPVGFSSSFAKRLNSLLPYHVMEVTERGELQANSVYIAPGDKHLQVKKRASRYYVEASDGELVSGHKPSVDVLFNSIAENCECTAVCAVILTGMGHDGAKGMRQLRERQAFTIAQDEASSVVWGMPGEAVKQNGVDAILPLRKISGAIKDFYKELIK